MATPKEALAFYESERQNSTLSHNDFAREENFEYLEESDELTDYLLSKQEWEKYFVKQKSGITTCDVVIVNKVFEACYKNFGKKMDTVQIFFIVTGFYDIEGKYFFDKLVQLHRKRLVQDLEKRIGKMKGCNQTAAKDRIQMAFSLIFNNK